MSPIFRSLVLMCWCVLGGFAGDPPTLTTVDLFTCEEDTPLAISFNTLKSAADETGTSVVFRIVSVNSINGSLTIRNTSPATAPVPVVPGDLLESGMELTWTPVANSFGKVDAFSIVAWDGALASAPDVAVPIMVNQVNDIPTLTNVSTLSGDGGLPLGNEDTEIIITHSKLLLSSNATDVEGPINFVIKQILNGTLRIRALGTTVSGVNALNQTLDQNEELVWKPTSNAFGDSVLAFRVRATDNTDTSTTDVDVTVKVANVPDPPTFTTLGIITPSGGAMEDQPIIISYNDIASKGNEADPDGDVISFKISSLINGSGSLSIQQAGKPLTRVTAEAGAVITSNHELYWQPPTNANGAINVCNLVAKSGSDETSPPLTMTIQVEPVEDSLTVTPNPVALDYSLNINAANFLFSTTPTVGDPDGPPIFIASGDKRLTITGTFTNRQGLEDELLVRNTAECKVDVTGSGTWDIVLRANTAVKLASASFDMATGTLVVTVDPLADTHAKTTNPSSHGAILARLLGCIAYTNNAGTFAKAQTTVRKAKLVVKEAGAKNDADPVLADISLKITNEAPGGFEFDPLYAEPGGRGVLRLKAKSNGTIEQIDKITLNDDLTFELITFPQHGELIDLATLKPITRFKGDRLNSTTRASGIGYRNTNVKATSDVMRIRALDEGNLSSEAAISITISPEPGKALIVSDPVLVLQRTVLHKHTLLLSGPPGVTGTVTIGELPGFTKPALEFVYHQAIVNNKLTSLQVFSVTTSGESPESKGSASVTLDIKPPKLTSLTPSKYLGFTVTWRISDDNQITQSFIICLDPTPPLIPLPIAN